MPFLPSEQNSQKRIRGSRTVGRVTICLLFLLLTGMNYAASMVIPFIGHYGWYFMGALIISTIWNTVLLTVLAFRNGWARFVLATFLVCAAVAQILVIPEFFTKYPFFREEGLKILIIVIISYLFTAVCLIVSSDIRWLSKPSQHSSR